MVAVHVEAQRVQTVAHDLHERLRPTAIDIAFQIVRSNQTDHQLVETALITRPDRPRVFFFDKKRQAQTIHSAGHMLQTFTENQVGRLLRTGDDTCIGFVAQVVQVSRHGHHRCNARPRPDEQVFALGVFRQGKDTRRAIGLDLHARTQVVQHPTRADAVGLGLNRDADVQWPRRAGRQRIGPRQRATRHRQFKRDELPRLVIEPRPRRRAERECCHVPRFRNDHGAFQFLGVCPRSVFLLCSGHQIIPLQRVSGPSGDGSWCLRTSRQTGSRRFPEQWNTVRVRKRAN